MAFLYIYDFKIKGEKKETIFIHDKVVYVPYDLYAQRNGKQLI